MRSLSHIAIPDVLVATRSRAWVDTLPQLIADFMDRWALRLDGQAMHGAASLVLPVTCSDGNPAALKLQPADEESIGEPIGLQVWNGHGVVRVLDHDPETCTMLLERLDSTRPLTTVADEAVAVQILAELLARLVAVPAPSGLRRLADIAATMIGDVPGAAQKLADPGQRRLLTYWSSVVAELIGDAGDRLLHWDLHYDNILAGQREPWLAIDPVPLAGHPGFDLLPAIGNRWDEVVATGNVPGAIRRRFDQLTEVVDVDRQHATGWTIGRVLQNSLWDIEDGKSELDRRQITIATALLHRRAR